LAKVEHGDGVVVAEGVDGLNAGVADGGEQGGGGGAVSAVVAEEADHAEFTLELRPIDVEVHAVDALDLQSNVVADDFGYSAYYSHGWLRSSRSITDQPTAVRFHWGCCQHTRSRHDWSLLLYILSV
jgi:hypothetical protein